MHVLCSDRATFTFLAGQKSVFDQLSTKKFMRWSECGLKLVDNPEQWQKCWQHITEYRNSAYLSELLNKWAPYTSTIIGPYVGCLYIYLSLIHI